MTDIEAAAQPAPVGQVQRHVRRLVCWWFGCQPDYEALRHDCDAVPCERCGAPDTSYADRVGDTRHNRLFDRWHRLTWLLVRRWLPHKCPACGARWKCATDCDGIPF
jgi:hypothetical protein